MVAKFISFALVALLLSNSASFSQETVSLADLPGRKIDSNWFRYINQRFGLAIDIPARGYRYQVPVNGSGLTLLSADEKVSITIYTHWAVGLFADEEDLYNKNNKNADALTKLLFEKRYAINNSDGSTVDYSVLKKNFYVLSGDYQDNTYYERWAISPKCPAIFSSVRIFSPKAKEAELNKLITRMSLSLRSTCRGEEGAGRQ